MADSAEESWSQFLEAGPWVQAGYSGSCKGCGERIEEGDMIRYAQGEGGFVCAECGQAA